MRVVFLYRGAEAIGVEALMAYIKAQGHEVRLVFDPAVFSGDRGRDIPSLAGFFDETVEEVADRVLALEPDVLAVSVITGIYRWALDVVKKVKENRNVPAVFGGIHPTAVPESVITQDVVDAIVLGEGEEALAELVEGATEGGFRNPHVANAWVKSDGKVVKNPVRPYIADLDSLPFALKDDYYAHMPVMKRHYKIISSRGCPNQCTYCCNNIFHRLYGKVKHVRRRSPSNVVTELEEARRKYKPSYVEFWDDIFTKDADWLEEFSGLYKRKIGLPFQCYAHPVFFDRRRARSLGEAGCVLLKLGVQTIDENVLKHTLKRPGKTDSVKTAIAAAREAGMRVNVEHILGLPGEGPEAQSAAARFYAEARPDKIASFWLVYYPGATIGRTARDQGLLSDEDLADIESGDRDFLYTFMFPGGKAEKLQEELKSYQTLFDALPWLPERWVKRLVDNGGISKLPHSGLLHQALMVFNALRIREREDLQAVRYVLSRKHKPAQ